MLKNKICIVTGATGGIGLSIAKRFAEEGAIVYGGERKKGCLAKLTNNEVIGICLDVTSDENIREAIMHIKKQEGRIDVLINNAGVEYNELIGMFSMEHMEEMFRINVFGTLQMTNYCSRIMSTQKTGGSIINISSVVGICGNAGQSAYSATKGAIISFTRSAAKELGSKGVRVNSIAPGLTQTTMLEATQEKFINKRIQNIALGRLASTQDVANACVFFASDLSNYISGQILGVDGCTIM